MKTIRKLHLLLSAMLILHVASLSAQLDVSTTNVNAQSLAASIVGDGIEILSAELVCPEGASGFFSNGEMTNLGLDDGILLTTGLAVDAIGPNSSGSTSTIWNAPGDPDLAALVAPFPTFDACYLEFSFIPLGDEVSFTYVFASEEYNDFVCSAFNDVFAFFANGPGVDNVNIATLPDSDVPVTINTVNNGSVGSNGNPDNCSEDDLANSAFFVENIGGSTIEYDGFTVPLSAELSVIPGEEYSFKLAIADVGDASFDSGVFIQAQSLSSPTCDVEGGQLDLEGSATICSNFSLSDQIDLTLSSAQGDSSIFILSSLSGEILGLQESPSWNLDEIPVNQPLQFIHLSWEGALSGLEIGGQISDLSGNCFALSNAIPFQSLFVNAGNISTQSELEACASDSLQVDIQVSGAGGAAGQSVLYLLLDENDLILEFSTEPSFVFTEAGAYKIVRIAYIDFDGGTEGGISIGDMELACFELSNVILVSINDCGCQVQAGVLSNASGDSFCKSDTEADNLLLLELAGDAQGENSIFVASWQNGEIFAIGEEAVWDLAGVPENGVCEFRQLVWNGELSGLGLGANIDQISGACFDWSNPIAVQEYFSNAGSIEVGVPTTACADEDLSLSPTVSNTGGAFGQSILWIVSDMQGSIVEVSESLPITFAEAGEYELWRLGYAGSFSIPLPGDALDGLSGECFDLSNPISVLILPCSASAGGTHDNGIHGAEKLEMRMKVFPNPAYGEALIELKNAGTGALNFELYSMDGMRVASWQLSIADGGASSSYTLDLRGMAEGIYLLQAWNGDKRAVQKVLVGR